MFRKKSVEKELKMVWQVKKGQRISFLVGTAHFFPLRFRSSLFSYLKNARFALFEGPLDRASMDKVRRSGITGDLSEHLFNDLDDPTVIKITRALAPVRRDKHSLFVLNLSKFRVENPIYEMIRGMKPWLAFFTIWSCYLEQSGWKYSVDLEGFEIACELGKQIESLETIEEQIAVLEQLSRRRIIDFLRQVDHWDLHCRNYLTCYLNGNLEGLTSSGLHFPSRHPCVIEQRDEVFFTRMQPYLDQGDAIAFVGAPHIRGLIPLLQDCGYQIRGPGRSAGDS